MPDLVLTIVYAQRSDKYKVIFPAQIIEVAQCGVTVPRLFQRTRALMALRFTFYRHKTHQTKPRPGL